LLMLLSSPQRMGAGKMDRSPNYFCGVGCKAIFSR